MADGSCRDVEAMAARNPVRKPPPLEQQGLQVRVPERRPARGRAVVAIAEDAPLDEPPRAQVERARRVGVVAVEPRRSARLEPPGARQAKPVERRAGGGGERREPARAAEGGVERLGAGRLSAAHLAHRLDDVSTVGDGAGGGVAVDEPDEVREPRGVGVGDVLPDGPAARDELAGLRVRGDVGEAPVPLGVLVVDRPDHVVAQVAEAGLGALRAARGEVPACGVRGVDLGGGVMTRERVVGAPDGGVAADEDVHGVGSERGVGADHRGGAAGVVGGAHRGVGSGGELALVAPGGLHGFDEGGVPLGDDRVGDGLHPGRVVGALEVRDGPNLALPEGQEAEAAVVRAGAGDGEVAGGAGVDRGAGGVAGAGHVLVGGPGGAAAAGGGRAGGVADAADGPVGAVGVAVAVAARVGAVDRDVVVDPEVVARGEVDALGVEHGGAHGVEADAGDVEEAEALLVEGGHRGGLTGDGRREADGLVVAALGAQERRAEGDLRGVAGGLAVAEHADGDVGEVGSEVGLLGVEDGPVHDVEVAERSLTMDGGVLEDGRVGVARAVDEDGDGLGVDAAFPALVREHGVVAVDEVARPVDAHELAAGPGAVGGVLDDDVELLAGGLVVRAADVEVGADGEGRDDLASAGVLADAVGAAGGSAHEVIGEASEEQVLGDLPADLLELGVRGEPDEAGAGRLRDHGGLCIEGRLLAQHLGGDGLRTVAAREQRVLGGDEVGLVEVVRLHLGDGGALLGAAAGGERWGVGEQGERRGALEGL